MFIVVDVVFVVVVVLMAAVVESYQCLLGGCWCFSWTNSSLASVSTSWPPSIWEEKSQFCFTGNEQNMLRMIKTWWHQLSKTGWQHLFKTWWQHYNIIKKGWQHIIKTCWQISKHGGIIWSRYVGNILPINGSREALFALAQTVATK